MNDNTISLSGTVFFFWISPYKSDHARNLWFTYGTTEAESRDAVIGVGAKLVVASRGAPIIARLGSRRFRARNFNTILGKCIMRAGLGGQRVRGDGDCSEREDGEDGLAEMHCEYGV